MRMHSWWRYLAVVPLLALPALAQEPLSAVLRPPKGAKVAIVVFEDLQCPDCSRAAPLLREAAKSYKIPQVRYDFPLPKHGWAREAAIYAKFFDSKPEALGGDFRDYIFGNQAAIGKDNLRTHAEKFAAEHELALPSSVDPKGELDGKVQRDIDAGTSVGVRRTPTIYVVSAARVGTPFVEVVDRGQLFLVIESVKRQADW